MRRGPVLLLLLALLGPRKASAQQPAQPPAPQQLVPPKLLSDAAVAYPEGASGEHEVVLRLRIDASGRVEDASSLQGDEPFVSAALAAARGLSFEPATRGGKPVPAFIRFLFRFVPPAPPAPSASSARPGPPPDAAQGSASPDGRGAAPDNGGSGKEPPQEVTVMGAKTPPGAQSLARAEVRQLPGAFGDPFRAIEALPGVTPLVSGAPFYYVRGAPPGNVGYFLDGVRVPYLFHVFLGPSVVNPAMVDRVNLHPGGYPARFGRFAGGIVEGETTPPVAELHGEAVLRLFDAGALVEAPFAGGKGTALLGGRYSYTALLFSLLSPQIVLDYWDYQARVAYRVSPSATVSVFAFGARDFLGQKEDGATRTFFDAQFHRVDLRYDDDLGGQGSTRIAVTLGLDRTGGEGGSKLGSRSARLRSQSTRPLGRAVVAFGADLSVEDFNNNPGQPSPDDQPPDAAELSQRQILTTRQDLATGVHGEVALPLGPVVFTAGVRGDLYASSDTAQPAQGVLGAARSDQGRIAALAVEPRLSVRAVLSPRVRTIHTFGVAHQPPSFVVPLPGYQPSPLRGGLQRSLQASSGVEVDLGEGVSASVTVFRSLFSNLSDALGTRPVNSGGPDTFESRADGTATGLELYLRRSLTRRLGGYISYTLSRSDRSSLQLVEPVSGVITPSSFQRVTYPSNFDRTHVLSGALGYDLGRRWRAGGRLVFYTGVPIFGSVRTSSPLRTDPFYRLDVRLEKGWSMGEKGKISLIIEALNTTLRKESFGQRCDESGCKADEIGPVFVPSVGVEAAF